MSKFKPVLVQLNDEEGKSNTAKKWDSMELAAFLLACGAAMAASSREALVNTACFENKNASKKFTARALTIAGFIELVANPLIGKVSDSIGRRSTLESCTLALSVAHLGVFASPRSKVAHMLDHVLSAVCFSSSLNILRACQADLSSNTSDLAIRNCRLARFVGAAMVFGPLLGASVRRASGNSHRTAFLFSAALAAATASLIHFEGRETNLQRKEELERFDFSVFRPLSYVEFLGGSSTFRTLLCILSLQAFGETGNLLSVQIPFMKNHLEMGPVRRGNIVAASGAAAIVATLFSDQLIQSMGLQGHQFVSTACQVHSSLLWGVSSFSRSFGATLAEIATFISIGAQRKRDGIECMAIALQDPVRLHGNAELIGHLSNVRIISSLVATKFLQWVSSNSVVSRSLPGAPFFLIAGTSLVGQRMLESVSGSSALSRRIILNPEEVKATKNDHSSEVVILDEQTESNFDLVATTSSERYPTKNYFDYVSEAPVGTSSKGFLDKTRQAVTLQEKVIISHDTRLFRFALPQKEMTLGLPVGKHVKIWCKNPTCKTSRLWNGKPDAEADSTEIERKYTPSSGALQIGYFDLVVKVYGRNSQADFPDGGKMTQHLDGLRLGDSVDIAGPFGLVEYNGSGRFTIQRKERNFSRIGLVAGGSGITPFLQLIREILSNEKDETKISLLYANRTVDDILFHDLFDELTTRHPVRFRIWYCLSQPPEDWGYSTGHINAQMLRETMPPPKEGTSVFMCGPPGMIEFGCKENLHSLGYTRDMMFEF